MSITVALQNGAEVAWEYTDAFNNATLCIKKRPESDKDELQCGNPWNWMTKDEEDKVNSIRPPPQQTKPCKIDSMMFHKFYTCIQDIASDITDIINSDCWGIFVTNADRSRVVHVFYDNRSEPDKGDEKMRTRLAKDPVELTRFLHLNCTLVLVLGEHRFMEYYFFKATSSTYVSVQIDHSINW